MKISSRVRRFAIASSAMALGAVLVTGSAWPDDMAGMDMSGSGMGTKNGTMGPPPMGDMAHMDNHMRMTELRPSNSQDEARARGILTTLRGSIARYRNYRVALAQGMRIFLPDIPQDVYHFTNYSQSNLEYQGRFDLRSPGSLLYTKNGAGSYSLIGAMYSAPPDATMDDLDAIVPLSVARWHVHTNICLPADLTIDDILRNDIDANQPGTPGMLPVSSPNAADLNHRYGFLADGRFGFEGKIFTERDCRAAGGHLIEQAFGWMVHVYPFSGDDLKVAYGMDVPKPIADTASASR